MVNGTELNTGEMNKRDWDDYFKLWKHYEDIAMHFNELIIRLRTQSIGGLAALAAVLGFVLKNNEGSDGAFCYGLASVAIGFLILCWIAVWVLDLLYYNRLLEGSVNAILELEKRTKMAFGEKRITLSSDIERAFSVRFEHEGGKVEKSRKERECNFRNGRTGFYGIVLVALLLLFVSSLFMMCRQTCENNESQAKSVPLSSARRPLGGTVVCISGPQGYNSPATLDLSNWGGELSE